MRACDNCQNADERVQAVYVKIATNTETGDSTRDLCPECLRAVAEAASVTLQERRPGGLGSA